MTGRMHAGDILRAVGAGDLLFLPLIWNCLPHARFVRTQFLTALGLLAAASVSSWNDTESWYRWLLLIGAGTAL